MIISKNLSKSSTKKYKPSTEMGFKMISQRIFVGIRLMAIIAFNCSVRIVLSQVSVYTWGIYSTYGTNAFVSWLLCFRFYFHDWLYDWWFNRFWPTGSSFIGSGQVCGHICHWLWTVRFRENGFLFWFDVFIFNSMVFQRMVFFFYITFVMLCLILFNCAGGGLWDHRFRIYFVLIY